LPAKETCTHDCIKKRILKRILVAFPKTHTVMKKKRKQGVLECNNISSLHIFLKVKFHTHEFKWETSFYSLSEKQHTQHHWNRYPKEILTKKLHWQRYTARDSDWEIALTPQEILTEKLHSQRYWWSTEKTLTLIYYDWLTHRLLKLSIVFKRFNNRFCSLLH